MPDLSSTGTTIVAAIVKESLPHTINVIVHVTFGTLALVLGLMQLLRPKRGAGHVRRGRSFLVAVGVIVSTAAIGSLVFSFRAFLAVITMLVAYEAYSGYRALRIRHTGPVLQDAIVAVAGLLAAVSFVIYIRTLPFPWAPAVIYSTLGTLLAIATYDLARFTFPRGWFATLWLYEHLVKMIGALSGVVSAFAGTVLVAWQPYSQLVPSAVLTMVALGYVLTLSRRDRSGSGSRSTPTAERPIRV